MPIRVVRFQTRNPVAAAAVLLLVLALLAVVLTVGLTLVAGLAVAGGAALLVRRVVGGRLPRGAPPALERPLDPGREVFPPAPGAEVRRLPPGER